MSFFLDALSDAASQMTETLASVVHTFGAGWVRGLEALLDRPAALFYLVAFYAVVVFIVGGLRGAGRAGYRRGRFLTANEKSFLMTLDAALGRNYRAFVQVRLAELVTPTHGANPASRRQALNGVMAKSVDFVICDVLTLDPVAAIEVDDRSHLLPERQQRDAFVNAWRRARKYARWSAIARRRLTGRTRAWNWWTAIGMMPRPSSKRSKASKARSSCCRLSGPPRPITKKPRV